ncbi:hypothetical protein GEMRC1_010269 [Eukaryota sp. GEM-RC1]
MSAKYIVMIFGENRFPGTVAAYHLSSTSSPSTNGSRRSSYSNSSCYNTTPLIQHEPSPLTSLPPLSPPPATHMDPPAPHITSPPSSSHTLQPSSTLQTSPPPISPPTEVQTSPPSEDLIHIKPLSDLRSFRRLLEAVAHDFNIPVLLLKHVQNLPSTHEISTLVSKTKVRSLQPCYFPKSMKFSKVPEKVDSRKKSRDWIFYAPGNSENEAFSYVVSHFEGLLALGSSAQIFKRFKLLFSDGFLFKIGFGYDVDVIDDVITTHTWVPRGETEPITLSINQTDGCGLMSPEFFDLCGLNCHAFQGRFQGSKGMFVLDSESSKKITLRKSQIKFSPCGKLSNYLNMLNRSEVKPGNFNLMIGLVLLSLGLRSSLTSAMQAERRVVKSGYFPSPKDVEHLRKQHKIPHFKVSFLHFIKAIPDSNWVSTTRVAALRTSFEPPSYSSLSKTESGCLVGKCLAYRYPGLSTSDILLIELVERPSLPFNVMGGDFDGDDVFIIHHKDLVEEASTIPLNNQLAFADCFHHESVIKPYTLSNDYFKEVADPEVKQLEYNKPPYCNFTGSLYNIIVKDLGIDLGDDLVVVYYEAIDGKLPEDPNAFLNSLKEKKTRRDR